MYLCELSGSKFHSVTYTTVPLGNNFPIILEYSQIFPNICEYFWLFFNTLEYFATFWNILEYSHWKVVLGQYCSSNVILYNDVKN